MVLQNSAFAWSLGLLALPPWDGYSRECQTMALHISGLVLFAELLQDLQSDDFVFLQELVFYFRPVTGI